jgi:hypothetical protein
VSHSAEATDDRTRPADYVRSRGAHRAVAPLAVLCAAAALILMVWAGVEPPSPPAVAATLAGPQTIALANVDVVAGSGTRLPYRIDDSAAPDATAAVVITTLQGGVAATLAIPGPVATGKNLLYTFTCHLAPGTYRYHVEAVDSLGSAQVASRDARLRVLPVFPQAAGIGRAAQWLQHRKGLLGFAVIDDRGKLRGYQLNLDFASASVVKAMLLVEYLRTHGSISTTTRARLARMIIVSDNVAASQIFGVVGQRGLYACARLAGMTHFSVGSNWALAQISAADQARLFILMDSFVPSRYLTWVRYLFSHITPVDHWGIPAVAGPAGWQVFFKGGYMPYGNGIVVHEASRLERRGVVFSLVVLTSGRETLDYGIGTLRGAAQRVLGLRASARSGLEVAP